jgi:taspase (threonine aspartase 1)
MFIAVHVGAGNIATESEADLELLIRDACDAAANALQNGSGCEVAACAAVEWLENSSLTNAGLGSNFNAEGLVEADASVMYSRRCSGGPKAKRLSGFGAVGAAPGLDNPIQVALAVAHAAEVSRPKEYCV